MRERERGEVVVVWREKGVREGESEGEMDGGGRGEPSESSG